MRAAALLAAGRPGDRAGAGSHPGHRADRRQAKKSGDRHAPPADSPICPRSLRQYKKDKPDAGRTCRRSRATWTWSPWMWRCWTTRATSSPASPEATSACWKTTCRSRSRRVNMGEAPMTVAMVIEFSNLFQSLLERRLVPDAATGLGLRQHSEAARITCAVVAYDISRRSSPTSPRTEQDAGSAAPPDHSGMVAKPTCSTPSPTRPTACRGSKGARPSC